MRRFGVISGGLANTGDGQHDDTVAPEPSPTAGFLARRWEEGLTAKRMVKALDDPTVVKHAGRSEMSGPTREEFDAKIAAAEARTQTLFAQIDGKIGTLSTQINAKIEGISTELKSMNDAISHSRSEVHREVGSLRFWVISTGVAIFLGVGGLVIGVQALGLSSMQAGISIAPPEIRIVPMAPLTNLPNQTPIEPISPGPQIMQNPAQ